MATKTAATTRMTGVDCIALPKSDPVVAATTPSADPYYVCAVFGVGDAVQRVPLPQILPEAAASRRSFSLPPETVRLVTLLEQVVPEQLDAVREAGRAYLVRRRDWLSQGRIGK